MNDNEFAKRVDHNYNDLRDRLEQMKARTGVVQYDFIITELVLELVNEVIKLRNIIDDHLKPRSYRNPYDLNNRDEFGMI